ncbi:unnamed protein product [Schistocephalus solidus]|uniref:G_PROTEIN_RECEP_F1_2 domain-containing protein n=1 Tax=Schistocephalus solidus TaxID=70667 RepID=A0A183T4R3_SCHSO|nr:unnamed protein product [Schistocephalus solidus]
MDIQKLSIINNDTDALPPQCRNLYESGLARILVTHISFGIALLGIPANIFALIAYRSPTHILLIALAIEDIMIILFYGIYYIAIHYYESYHIEWLGFLRYIDTPLFYLVNWIKMIEIYTVVLLSLERYTAIRWPLKAAHLCSVGRTKRGLLFISLFSGVFKLPNLILDYPWYDTFKLVHVQLLDQVCSFVIPLSLLVFLNCGLIMRIRRFEKRHRSGQWSSKRINGSATTGTGKTSYKPSMPNSFVLQDDEDDFELNPLRRGFNSFRAQRDFDGNNQTVSRGTLRSTGGPNAAVSTYNSDIQLHLFLSLTNTTASFENMNDFPVKLKYVKLSCFPYFTC